MGRGGRGLIRSHLDSLAFLANHLLSLCFTWSHWDSLGSYLDTFGITWPHLEALDPLDVTGLHLFSKVSLGFTWYCLVSLGLISLTLVSLGPT